MTCVANIDRILEIMSRLRDPEGGCPWDLEQSFETIVLHTIEEAYEVADCIERGSLAELPGELGDLLFQVVFYAQLGREQKLFNFEEILHALETKLTSRHPHVFANDSVSSADEQARRWEETKAAERAASSDLQPHSELNGVPRGLPALTRARKLQQRASRVGFDWPNITGVRDKVVEELEEVDAAIAEGSNEHIAEEMGDLLFACVNWARHLGVEPESALRAASRKFSHRFRFVENALRDADIDIGSASLETMDELWNEAKRLERN